MNYGDVNFKAGGNAEADAFAAQENFDSAKLANAGKDLGVGNPDAQSDEDFTAQAQNTQAAAAGGQGGQDNVYQDIRV
jgi:hypothetical protein